MELVRLATLSNEYVDKVHEFVEHVKNIVKEYKQEQSGIVS